VDTKTKQALILEADRVAARPWERFGEDEGVRYRTLWIEPGSRSYAGVLRLDSGAAIGHHTHRHASHHVWVADGDCRIDGRHLEAGSYVCVPAGVDHGVDAAGPQGCALFYLYLREPGT